MIWILASTPFWFVGASLAVMGAGALIYGLFSARVSSDEFCQAGPFAMVVTLCGGVLMVFAAHLCR